MSADPFSWATIAPALISAFSSLIKPLVYAFVYWAGKRAARSELDVLQAKRDAELAKAWLENRLERRTPEDTKRRIDDGTF